MFREQHMFEEEDLPDALLRIGFEFADGTRVSNLGGWRAHGKLMSQDAPKRRFSDRVEEALVAVDELVSRFGKSAEVKVRELVANGLLNKGAMLDMLHRREEAAAVFGALLTHFQTGESVLIDEYLAIAARRRQKLLRSYR